MATMRRGPLVRLLNVNSGVGLIQRRCLAHGPSSSPTKHHPLRRALFLTGAVSVGAVMFGIWTDARTRPEAPYKLALSSSTNLTATPTSAPAVTTSSLSALLRSYAVYALISVPTLVDHAPELLNTLLKIPLLGPVVENFVKGTFYSQFVGGESTDGALPLLSQLRSENKGVLFAYSVEVDEDEAGGETDAAQAQIQDQTQPMHKRIVDEMINSIDVSAAFEDRLGSTGTGRRTWVAVKLTALVPHARSLHNLSMHLTCVRPVLSPPVPFPGTPSSSDLALLHASPSDNSLLTIEDAKDLKELYEDLNRICVHAKERGVKVIIDAEYSWYQPAVDAFGHALMERFNKLPNRRGWMARWLPEPKAGDGLEVQPLVYVTYQAYLRRTPAHLAHSLAIAHDKGFALGVKLVRGAYHPHELAAHPSQNGPALSISPDPYPPVHLTKADTDACYNNCAALLVRAVADDVLSPHGLPRIGVLFGTHNWTSCELVLEQLVKNGLARVEGPEGTDLKGTIIIPPEVAERFAFGQLYGMSDSLTNYLVERTRSTTPCVIKYVPYGSLVEVMPYLSRRAIENKSVLSNGGATRERKEAAALMWRRVFGEFGM